MLIAGWVKEKEKGQKMTEGTIRHSIFADILFVV